MTASFGVLDRQRPLFRRVRICAGEVWTDLFPTIALVGAAQHVLRAEIKRVRILRREHQRRGPGEAVFRMGFAEVANCIGRNVLRLAGAAIVTEKLAVGSSAINDAGIGRIRRNVAALTCSGRMPVTEGNGAIIAAAENVYAAAILLRAVNVVREFIVDRNVVELRGGLVVPTAPGVAAIYAHARALIAAKDHALRIAGIDPQSVIVIAAGRALDGHKVLACVSGAIDGNVGQVNGVGIFGINREFAEVPQTSADARVCSGASPGLAAIVWFKEA